MYLQVKSRSKVIRGVLHPEIYFFNINFFFIIFISNMCIYTLKKTKILKIPQGGVCDRTSQNYASPA